MGDKEESPGASTGVLPGLVYIGGMTVGGKIVGGIMGESTTSVGAEVLVVVVVPSTLGDSVGGLLLVIDGGEEEEIGAPGAPIMEGDSGAGPPPPIGAGSLVSMGGLFVGTPGALMAVGAGAGMLSPGEFPGACPGELSGPGAFPGEFPGDPGEFPGASGAVRTVGAGINVCVRVGPLEIVGALDSLGKSLGWWLMEL